MRMILVAVAALTLVPPVQTPLQGQLDSEPTGLHEIIITDVMIPMRDGVHLNARLYRPIDLAEPGPAILTLTPYTSDDAHERASSFARNGYVYINANTRGRGGSEGESWPLEQDGPDGHDSPSEPPRPRVLALM